MRHSRNRIRMCRIRYIFSWYFFILYVMMSCGWKVAHFYYLWKLKYWIPTWKVQQTARLFLDRSASENCRQCRHKHAPGKCIISIAIWKSNGIEISGDDNYESSMKGCFIRFYLHNTSYYAVRSLSIFKFFCILDYQS